MNQRDFVQVALFLGALFVVTPFLGRWMAGVFAGEKTLPFLRQLEKLIYRLAGIDARREMGWKRYLGVLLAFNALGVLSVLALEMTQAWLPLNPQKLPNLPFPLAFSTAISFVTNTNWQAYAGESTMSYGTQMLALCVQNFLSAATGLAVAIALIRGLTRRSRETLGNFWADLTRGTLYVLLPLSFLFALVLAGQGVVQSLAPYADIATVEGARQTIPLGPAASQIAIKQIGTNGGGFFGQNSAHPFENPTPLTNFLEIFVIFAIPAGLTYTFGCMAGNRRQGWAIFGAMLVLFIAGFAVAWPSELAHNPATGLTASMEGKETRFGVMNSVLFATVTTDASCGAVNAMHDSLAPLTGMVTLVNMMLGEVVFGGVGAGLYGMLIFAILTVFIAGLMVGRTPEYLGKKIEAREITWAVVAVLVPSVAILAGTAIGCMTAAGVSSCCCPSRACGRRWPPACCRPSCWGCRRRGWAGCRRRRRCHPSLHGATQASQQPRRRAGGGPSPLQPPPPPSRTPSSCASCRWWSASPSSSTRASTRWRARPRCWAPKRRCRCVRGTALRGGQRSHACPVVRYPMPPPRLLPPPLAARACAVHDARVGPQAELGRRQ